MTKLQRLAAGVCLACAATVLAGCAGDDLRVVPLDRTKSQGKRVTVSGVDRWAHVLGETLELRFGGTPFEGCDLVWTCAALGESLPAQPILRVFWESQEGTRQEPLFSWPTESAPAGDWTEIRVPLRNARAGDAVFRLLPQANQCDSVAIVAPRLESSSLRRKGASDRCNVVLIVMDTFRYDHVSRYGSTTTITPSIDAFLSRCLEFASAYTRTTFTLPSHVSMLTGLPPRSHGVRKNGQVLDASVPTVARLAHAIGYRTGAFFEIATLREPSGFSTGFDSYTFCLKHRDPVLVRSGTWLQSVDREPFFLFVNLATVHLPRHPPQGVWQLSCSLPTGQEYRFRADERMENLNVIAPPGTTKVRFRARQSTRESYNTIREPLRLGLRNWLVDAPDEINLRWETDVEQPANARTGAWDWTRDGLVFTDTATLSIENSSNDTAVVTLGFEASMPRDVLRMHDQMQYALAVAALDSVVGDLLQVVDRFSDPERTAIMLASDHGEGLEDHYRRYHGHEVYDETAHVVLGIRYSDCEPQTISDLVSLDALAPTMLALMNLHSPAWMAHGVLKDPVRHPQNSLVSESFDLAHAADPEPVPDDQAIRTDQWSLIRDHDGVATALYDRCRDLGETENLARSHPQVVDSLGRLLDETTRSQTSLYMPGAVSDDPGLLKALRALGYVE